MKIQANEIFEICSYMRVDESDAVNMLGVGTVKFTVVNKNGGESVIQTEDGKFYSFYGDLMQGKLTDWIEIQEVVPVKKIIEVIEYVAVGEEK